MRKKDCRDCGQVFELPTTRGRPPVKCGSCRGVKTKTPAITTVPIPNPKSKNGLYRTADLVSYLDENPTPIGAQNVAEVLRGL